MNEPLGALSILEFCTLNSVSRSFAYAEIKAGRLRAKKAGDRTLITRTENAQWLSALPDAQMGTAA